MIAPLGSPGRRGATPAGAVPEPVAFFAYADKPSLLMPEGAKSTKLAEDIEAALEALGTERDATD